MNPCKPVMLMPPVIGTTWYVALSWKDRGDGSFEATSKRPLVPENGERLNDALAKAYWAETLVKNSKMTPEQIESLVKEHCDA